MEHQAVFSIDSYDVGKTKLVTIDMDAEDSPPISQKPYTLLLKHTA